MAEDLIKGVTPAPKWLVDRMEAIRKQPPPTLEEVQKQMDFREDYRKKYGNYVR